MATAPEQPSKGAYTSAPGDVSQAATKPVSPVEARRRANEAQLAALLGAAVFAESQAIQLPRQGS